MALLQRLSGSTDLGRKTIRPSPKYGKGSDAGPPQVGAGSLSFCFFFFFVSLGLPAGFPTFPAFDLRNLTPLPSIFGSGCGGVWHYTPGTMGPVRVACSLFKTTLYLGRLPPPQTLRLVLGGAGEPPPGRPVGGLPPPRPSA